MESKDRVRAIKERTARSLDLYCKGRTEEADREWIDVAYTVLCYIDEEMGHGDTYTAQRMAREALKGELELSCMPS